MCMRLCCVCQCAMLPARTRLHSCRVRSAAPETATPAAAPVRKGRDVNVEEREGVDMAAHTCACKRGNEIHAGVDTRT